MRPIKLSLQAIGPFKSKVEVDFSRIGNHELFLIHGKTGSGKTTLFDAICYALYGTVPSGREGCLKSDFAEETDMPFVEFEFELGPDRYRARRQLAHKRMTQAGNSIGVPEKLEFNQVLEDESTKILATKKTEIATEVQARLGLDVNQFSQVVLLPQGEFRRLLLANSSDREGLLEKLFDTIFYNDIQQWFEQEARAFEQQNREIQQRRETYLGQAREKIQEDRRPAEEAQFGVETLDEEVGLLTDQIKKDQIFVKKQSAAVEKQLKQLEAGRQLKKNLIEMWHVNEQQELFAEQKPEMDLQKMELKSAREVAPLIPELDEVGRAQTAVTDGSNLMSEAQKKYKAVASRKEAGDKKSKKIPQLKTSMGDLGTLKEGFGALRQTVGNIVEHSEQQEERQEELIEASEQLDQAKTQAKELKNQQKAWRVDLKKLADAAVDLTVLIPRRDQVEEAIKKSDRIKDLTGRLKKQKEASASAVKAQKGAKVALTAVRERRERNLAGELAQGLEKGKPCSVCGSKEHPQPATVEDDEATLDAIQQAEERLQKVDQDLKEAKDSELQVQATLDLESKQLKNMEAWLGGSATPQEFQTLEKQIVAEEGRTGLFSDLEEKIQTLEVDDIPESKVELERAKNAKNAIKRNLLTVEKKLETLETQFGEQCTADLEKWLEADEVGLDEIDEAVEQIQETVDELTQMIEAIQAEATDAKTEEARQKSTLKAAENSLKKAKESAKALEVSVNQKIKDSSFESVEQVQEAARETGWILEADKEIKAFDQDMLTVATKQKELAKRIGKKSEPDVLAIEEAYDEQKNRYDDALAVFHTLEHNLNELKTLAGDIRDLEAEVAEVATKMKVLGRIDKQVRGRGQPKISLKRFFLAQRLEEVLIQASRRLQVLSNGRFELKRNPNVADARAGAGLDLLVSDNYTGTERPVNSLSGGQMFLASLSMALGLADVVQARSGGIRLDTLFVDEGFGSLDDETLQVALKVLNELREGRMVGVISHVSELKRQIENRIEVVATSVGSTVKMTVA